MNLLTWTLTIATTSFSAVQIQGATTLQREHHWIPVVLRMSILCLQTVCSQLCIAFRRGARRSSGGGWAECQHSWPCFHAQYERKWIAVHSIIDRQNCHDLHQYTAYSGIDAPGCSLLYLLAGIEKEFGLMTHPPSHLFAIEWDQACQTELQIHPAAADCVFQDPTSFALRCRLSFIHCKPAISSAPFCFPWYAIHHTKR